MCNYGIYMVLKYVFLLFLVGCAQLEQDLQTPTGQMLENVAEDVVEAVIQKETGVTIPL